MKYLEVFLCALWVLLFISVGAGISSDTLYQSIDAVQKDYHANSKFSCPSPIGAYPDPDDCSKYYICVFGIAAHKKCEFFLHFDIYLKRCISKLIATCGNGKGTTQNPARSTVSTSTSTATSTTGGSFKCPSFWGSFPDPDDCSKYYDCSFYRSTHKTCPKKQLFDAIKNSCKPEKGVHCGTRQRPPDFITTAISTESTIKITTSMPTESTTRSTIREIPETTTESTASEMLTETTEGTTESTTEVITSTIQTTTEDITTTYRPTGPPDHTCKEEDVDCIITETGDANDWFICPQDVGSYAHPSSHKLFIFCMNWIPSVKKCGQDLTFSKELSTCIEVKY